MSDGGDHRRSEAEILKSETRLRLLYELTAAVARADSAAAVYEKALDALIGSMDADRASVLLADAQGTMRFAAMRGLSAGYRAQAEGHSPWPRDARDPQPLLIPDAAADPALGALQGVILAEGIRSLAFIPIVSAGRLAGKFMVYFDAPRRLTEDELHLAATLAGHIGHALERERAELALRESTAIIKIVNEGTPTLLYAKDRAGRMTMANRAMLAALGRSESEAIGKTAVEYWGDKAAAARVMANDQETMRSGIGRSFEETILLPDGAHVFLSTKTPQRDAAGAVVGLIGASIDITERKRAELQLRESQAHLELATAAAGVGTWEWHIRTGDLIWSSIHKQLWGYDPALEKVDYESWASRIHKDDLPMTAAAIERCLKREADYDVEYRILRHGTGETRWIRSTGRGRFDEAGAPEAMQGVSFDITAQKAAANRQALLIQELNHRVKNTLATVQSIAAQTLRSSAQDADARASFESRLLALSTAHNVLTQESWEGAAIRQIVAAALRPFRAGGREGIAIDGPDIRLNPKSALSLAMALHELATNAAKYGALAVRGGGVEIRWSVHETGAAARFHLRWEERGGPPVAPPMRKGFGSRLIERGLSAEFGGTARIDYRAAGVTCIIDAPLANIAE